MGCSCCIEGHNEKETLEYTLRWTADWASHLAKDVMATQKALRRIGAGYYSLHGNYDRLSKEDLCADVDATFALIHGLEQCLNESFKDEEVSVLPNLLRTFKATYEKCEGKKPFGTTWLNSVDREQARKCLGDEKDVAYDIIRIDGNESFLRRQRYKDTLESHIVKAIEEERDGSYKIALLFESYDALHYLMTDCCETLSKIEKKYEGVKFLCPSNAIVEMNLAEMMALAEKRKSEMEKPEAYKIPDGNERPEPTPKKRTSRKKAK